MNQKLVRSIVAFLFIGSFIVTSIQGGSAKAASLASIPVDPRVYEDTENGETGSFLVVFDEKPSLEAAQVQTLGYTGAITALQSAAQASQRGAISQLDALAANPVLDVRYRPYWIANVIAVWGKRPVLEAMLARSDVREIASNRPFQVQLETPTTGSETTAGGVEWNVAQVHAPELWAMGGTGVGITYASADTGVAWAHPALQTHYRGWDGTSAEHDYNWWDAIHEQIAPNPNTRCPYNGAQPCDDYGHGTHVMGTGVGDDGSGNQIGVAPGAKWIACRNMDQGVGRPDAYIECLQFFVAPWDLNHQNPTPALHADVIGNSYSCTIDEGCTAPDVLHIAVENVRAAGIFMSVSAGNKGPGCGSVYDTPALEPDVFTVGAVDSQNQIANSSSRGPVTRNGSNRIKPDLVAPGVSVLSSTIIFDSSGNIYYQYREMSGTSMAAPHVAGAVALIWSLYPPLRHQVQQTEDLLRSTATVLYPSSGQLCSTDTTTSVPNNVYGSGALNLSPVFDTLFPYKIDLLVIYK